MPQNWASFGQYVGGISSLLNVIVFTAITVLIHRIDFNNRTSEQRITQQRQLLNRFLLSYEEVIKQLYTLKATLAYSTVNRDRISIPMLNETYISIKTLCSYSNLYRGLMSAQWRSYSDSSVTNALDSFLTTHIFALISIIDNNDSDTIFINQVNETTKGIEEVIDCVSKIAVIFFENGGVG
jgi:hypothetical protein